ncbi:hypothetical protein SEA_PUPPER_93 [Gordonia phage Pupper]|uniref:LysM-like endolysin n=1 Tax=Gordonia phage Pupper TaxID=2571249 RepID=A0A4Y6ES48_9CAUD|nr:hypothetical protein KHQ83_gp184 [Gordonia phage Pupper]QDF18579.1 hypothetical protein SEA_PUPPER_93 [Gordonia phage Pupper]QDF18811.1 hypothetical protein SEA_SCENTAE_92 [Gordonia phage SCentae]
MTQAYTTYGPGRIVASETNRGRTRHRVAGNGFDVWMDATDVRIASEGEGALGGAPVGADPVGGEPGMNNYVFNPENEMPNGMLSNVLGSHREAWAPVDFDNSTTLPYDPTPQYPALPGETESTIQPIHQIEPDERLDDTNSVTFRDEADDRDDLFSENFAKGASFHEANPAALALGLGGGGGGAAAGGAAGAAGGGLARGLLPQIPGLAGGGGGEEEGGEEEPGPLDVGGKVEQAGEQAEQQIEELGPGAGWGPLVQAAIGPDGDDYQTGDITDLDAVEDGHGAGRPDGPVPLVNTQRDRERPERPRERPQHGSEPDTEADIVSRPDHGAPADPTGRDSLPDLEDIDGLNSPISSGDVRGVGDRARSELNQLGPGAGWGGLVKAHNLGSKYVDLPLEVDHFTPMAQFQHDPVGFIDRHGHVVDDTGDTGNHRMAQYMDLVEGDRQLREAAWTDVRAKALRLRREGAVTVKDVGPDRIYANVKGDNGEYDVMIAKGGVTSGFGSGHAIANWHCACDWGKWAFKRKHTFVGRLCSHAYATYMEMQSQHVKNKPRTQKVHNPHPYRKRADALQSIPTRLQPELVINDVQDEAEMVDVQEDERKETGPEGILHFSRVLEACERDGTPYPRELVAFLERYAEDQTPEDWVVGDHTEGEPAVEELREYATEPQAEHFGDMEDHIDDVRDAVETARDNGMDASPLVASFHEAKPDLTGIDYSVIPGPGSHQPFNGSGPLPPLEIGTAEDNVKDFTYDDVTEFSDGDYDNDGMEKYRTKEGATDDNSDIVAAFQREAGAALMGNAPAAATAPSGGDDFAGAAAAFLRTAGRHYTPSEQAELMGERHAMGARNLDGLDLTGTHYEDAAVGLFT